MMAAPCSKKRAVPDAHGTSTSTGESSAASTSGWPEDLRGGRKRARSVASSGAGGPGAAAPPEAGSDHIAIRDGDDAALAALKGMTFYDALGVDPGATNAQIRRAFKAAALKHHPDKGGDARAFRYLSTIRDILLNKRKREQYDFSGRAPFAETFSQPPPGEEAAGSAAEKLPGQRVLFAPVSEMLEKMAGDAAWASLRWGNHAAGYRFDVLAAIVLKRAAAAGSQASGGARATRDVYRLGSGAVALGIQKSRLVSGRPSEGGGPASLQRETDACVPRSLAGLSAAQMKSTFRAVVLFGCVEFDLVSSWHFCAKELAASLGVPAPTLQRTV